MKETFHISEDLTVVFDGDSLNFKKNGLSVTVTFDELVAVQKRLQASTEVMANKLQAKIIDELNAKREREL